MTMSSNHAMNTYMKKLFLDIINNKITYILVTAFILISAIIRFTPLSRNDVPFLFDQGRDMLAVRQIVVDHKLTLIGPFTGLQGVFQGPLHYYLLAIPFFIFNGNPAAEIGMMVVLALVGIFLCYMLGRNMIDGKFGIVLALFFAFSSASISFSSYFWNPNWIPFCMVLLYYFLYKSIFTHPKYWIWTGLLAGIIAQFEVAFGLPLFISLFIVAILCDIKSLKSLYFWAIIPAFLVTFTPQALFDIRHQFLMTKTIISFLHGANGGTGGAIPFSTRIFYRINEIQGATIFTISNNRIVDYLLACSLPVFLITSLLYGWKKELKLFFIFLLIPLTFFVIFLFYSHEAWSWYWVGLQTSYYFLLAFILSTFLKKSKIYMGFSIALMLFWAIFTIIPEILGLSVITQGDTGTLKNELRVVDFIYHDANGKPFGEFVYTPPVYDYAYQHLFWWKSKQYGYSATKDKNGIFYLVIEPDPDHPYSINGWKQTVIKTGKVVWDKTFPGKITVEKREGK